MYFFWQWYAYDRYPRELIGIDPGQRHRSAVLDTPEGVIALDQPLLMLGNGASRLKKSPSTIEIQREGADHILKVLKGFITFTDPLSSDEDRLEPGSIRKLKHNDRLMMPGYHSLLRYSNSSRRR
jgi:hypothetical protein